MSEVIAKSIVLLVEDDPRFAKMSRDVLTRAKRYTIHEAENLTEARKQFNEIQPDVILLDGKLPDGHGFDFCEEIRGKTNAAIIFVTGEAKETDRAKGFSVGGDDYITKPFDIDDYRSRIEAAIERRCECK